MSEFLIVPIVALAVYGVVRQLQKDLSGQRGACSGCPSQSTCRRTIQPEAERDAADHACPSARMQG